MTPINDIQPSPRWTKIGSCLLAAALLVGMTINPAPSADLWWHLAIGRLMASTHAIPHQDPWSFTAPGHPWQNDEWLFSGITYLFYRIGGLHGVYVFKSCVLMGLFALLVRFGMQRSGGHPLIVILVALGCISLSEYPIFFEPRPQLASYTLLPLMAWLVWLYTRTDSVRWLWFCPVVTVVWANLHPGVMAGPTVVGLATVGLWLEGRRGQARHMALTLLACLLAVLLNVSGGNLVLYPFHLYHSVWNEHLNEWQPLIWREHWPFVTFMGTTLVASLIFRASLARYEILTCWAFGVLSLSGWRHVPIFCIMAVPWWCAMVSSRFTTTRFLPGARTWVAISIASLVWIGVRLSAHDVARQPLETTYFPRFACDFLEKNPLPTHVFAPYGLGGYLIWRLSPRYQDFVDGRAVSVFPAQVYTDYLAAAFDPTRTEEVFKRYGVDTLLCFQSDEVPEASVRIVKGLPDWMCIYVDDTFSVYVRKTAENQALADHAVRPPSPYQCRLAAQQALNAGHPEQAEPLLRQALALDDRDTVAARWMGVVCFRTGRPQEGIAWTRKSLEWDANQPEAWYNLAVAAATSGQKDEARQDAQHVLSLDPGNAAARHMLQQLDSHP